MKRTILSGQIATHELFSLEHCSQVVSKELPPICGKFDPKTLEANSQLVYLLLNTWGFLIEDSLDEDALYEFSMIISEKGLISTIDLASKAADGLVKGISLAESPFYRVCRKCENMKTILCVLRYPKRFSPHNPSELYRSGVKGFFAFNRGRKLRERKEYSTFLVERIRTRIATMLRGLPKLIDEDILSRGSFSSGTISGTSRIGNHNKCLTSKLDEMARWSPNLFGSCLYPISAHDYSYNQCCEVIPVPKNYKTPRIIARMSAPQNFFLKGLSEILKEVLVKNKVWERMNLDDATINSNRALLGSITGELATIDLTAASDCFTQSLIASVFPSDLAECLYKHSGKWLTYGDEIIARRYIALTMGSPVTMIMQSLFYLAVCDVSVDLYSFGKSRRELKYSDNTVYGDDIITNVLVCDTVMDVLTNLGFKVNEDKSFSGFSTYESLYRESCGVEAFHGTDVSQDYFPRKPFTLKDLDVVIPLQHKLYGISPQSSRFLLHWILEVKPDMTVSYPGEPSDDPWWDTPIRQKEQCKRVVVVVPDELTAKQLGIPEDRYKIDKKLAIKRDGHYPLTRITVEVGPDDQRHYHFTTRPTSRGFECDENVLDMWRYAEFLKNGPRYLSELDRLLGVSAPLRNPAHEAGAITSVLKKDFEWEPTLFDAGTFI